jgi:hypothetical protein
VTVADVAAAPATASVDDFISSISNLSPPILSSPPRLRVSQEPDYSVIPDDVDDARDDAVPTPPPEVDPGMLFVNSLRLPLPEALVRTPPRSRGARREPANLVPRRSDRLAAKSAFRDPNPEKQAKRVLVNKWERRPNDAPIDATDDRIAVLFHETFKEPVDSPTREALRELMFPSPCKRSNWRCSQP